MRIAGNLKLRSKCIEQLVNGTTFFIGSMSDHLSTLVSDALTPVVEIRLTTDVTLADEESYSMLVDGRTL